MPSVKIISNYQPRDVLQAYDLTKEERENFDYIDWHKIAVGEDNAEFARYKGELYHLQDVEAISFASFAPDHPFRKWDGYVSESFFSGILFKFVDNGEGIIMGRYYS